MKMPLFKNDKELIAFQAQNSLNLQPFTSFPSEVWEIWVWKALRPESYHILNKSIFFILHAIEKKNGRQRSDLVEKDLIKTTKKT